MALHEFYLDFFGPVKTDLDEEVIESLRKTWRPGLTEKDIDNFFENRNIVNNQEKVFYIIAAEGDPDTMTNGEKSWDSLYHLLKVIFKAGHWCMTKEEIEEAYKKQEG